MDLQVIAESVGFKWASKKGKKEVISDIINPASPKQLKHLLYEILDLPRLDKKYLKDLDDDCDLSELSTDKKVLAEITARLWQEDKKYKVELEFLSKLKQFKTVADLKRHVCNGH